MTIPIQLAIQGGGAKITYLTAALDAVQSLEREGLLRVTRIAGTSAGAICGALYAAGIEMRRARDAFEADRDALLRAFPPVGPARCLWKLLTRRPFWNPAPLRHLLARLLMNRATLGDLDIPLIVVATDLTNMQPCIYASPEQPLISSIMDSAGIPFFFRTAPAVPASYRVVVDGGICENLPSGELTHAPELGEVVGITFGLWAPAAPLTGFADFTRALVETAMKSSVLRAQLELGPNNFVIDTDAGSFDFERALTAGLGAEYRETKLLAEKFFREYVRRAMQSAGGVRLRIRKTTDGVATGEAVVFPQRCLHDVTRALRAMYEAQHEPSAFEILSVRMVVTAAPQWPGRDGADNIRHEVVFQAADHPIHCYRIKLISGLAPDLQKAQCELFDRKFAPIAFDLVPMTDEHDASREYLLFFRTPIVPGDPRAPVTLRVRDAVTGGLRLFAEGRDELLTRAARADRPIPRVEIVVHLPDELSGTLIAPAAGSDGTRMTHAELLTYAAPANYFTLGWKGENVPPNALFGCNLVRR
jgi:predicted acylesterase/phospholipase RssA